MTPPPIVVEYSDRGQGFMLVKPLHPDENYRAAKHAADSLLRSVIPQPPVRTGLHRVWSLLAVDIRDRGRHWCFAVQGRGGHEFGAAGTCQFVFADGARWQPSQLWNWCTSRAENGRYDELGIDQPLVRQLGDPDGTAVRRRVLDGLVAANARIPLGADPVAAAIAIGELLPVLPTDVVSRYLWSTCLLAKPYSALRPTIAGTWPLDLGENNTRAARDVAAWFDVTRRIDGIAPTAIDRLQQRALEWLAAETGSPDFSFRINRDTAGMAAVLDEVAQRLPVDVGEVGDLLDDRTAHNLLRNSLSAVADWALQHPQRAREHIADHTGSAEIQEALLKGLIRSPAAVELCPPPTPEPLPGWHTRVTQALTTTVLPGTPQMRKIVDLLREDGGPLQFDEALTAADTWIAELGLTRDAHPDLYPMSVERVAERLRAAGRLDDHDRAGLLAVDSSPFPILLQLAPHAGPDAAADLIEVLLDADRLPNPTAELGHLVAALVGDAPSPAEQFHAVLDRVEHRSVPIPQEFVRFGLEALGDHHELDLADDQRCAKVLSEDLDLDAGIRRLLGRLASPPRVEPQRVPARTAGNSQNGRPSTRKLPAAPPQTPKRTRNVSSEREPANGEPTPPRSGGRAGWRTHPTADHDRRARLLNWAAVVVLSVFIAITVVVIGALVVRGVGPQSGPSVTTGTTTETSAPPAATNPQPAPTPPPTTTAPPADTGATDGQGTADTGAGGNQLGGGQ